VSAFWSGSAQGFLLADRGAMVAGLAEAQLRHFRTGEAQLLRAWEETLLVLHGALARQRDIDGWWVLIEYPLLRLGRRADAILLTDRAILVLEFKTGAAGFDRSGDEQVEDYALDLQDFHAGCRNHPIVPILVATRAEPAAISYPLMLAGVTHVLRTNAAELPDVLRHLQARAPAPPAALDPAAWMAAPYRPVPTIVEAACMLYARHGVAEIKAARTDTQNLTITTEEILGRIESARRADEKLVLVVTGIPGAGKTLCGLNAAFGAPDAARATFLTGNPTLVHVLREALARNAIENGQDRRAARQQMEGAIQALPRFRDHYVATGEVPAERIIVVDEAQRCWSEAYAVRKSRDRAVHLTASEPALLLDIMGRHAGFAAVICLVGSGQEIHDGEGGLAEWGDALRRAPGWRAVAPPDPPHATDPRQSLGRTENLSLAPALHLRVPVRQVRSDFASAWVDDMLRGQDGAARGIVQHAGGVPFLVTRQADAMRHWLRGASRGRRRCGLLASSGAKRLRAVGLGFELPHMDAQAVARWFLDRWPDVRASDALEMTATEFSCQGLELDYVGLCWDADLIRLPAHTAWHARGFRGTAWTRLASADAIANQINTYRVLLTRARYETVIFVPPGAADDPTRVPALYDGIAAFLLQCGAGHLPAVAPRPEIAETEHALL
jgi:hypothetical protein